MHAPVNGYLSMPCIYLIISRSGGGGEDKSADCVHCGAFFLQPGGGKWGGGGAVLNESSPAAVWERVSSAKPVWRQSMEISQR